MVVNSPGTQVECGETPATYVGSGPPKNTGLHRYVVLIFEQKKTIHWPKYEWLQKTHEHRAGFDLKKFIEKYDMGDLIAGNCWRSSWDKSVPALYKELQENYDTMPRNIA